MSARAHRVDRPIGPFPRWLRCRAEAGAARYVVARRPILERLPLGLASHRPDAQFWTRQLHLSGQALLDMSPNPDDSIPSFDVALVR
jgi:hypothetical protein